MENNRNLENFFGVATFIASLVSAYLLVAHTWNNPDADYVRQTYLEVVLFPLLPALVTMISAYLHAAKQSRLAFWLLLLVGGFLALFSAVISPAIVFLYMGIKGLFVVSPGVFAAAAIFFALRSPEADGQ